MRTKMALPDGREHEIVLSGVIQQRLVQRQGQAPGQGSLAGCHMVKEEGDACQLIQCAQPGHRLVVADAEKQGEQVQHRRHAPVASLVPVGLCCGVCVCVCVAG